MWFRPSLLAIAVVALVGCSEGSSGLGQGFKESYAAARSALEAGRYPVAIRHYNRLVDAHSDHPIATRLRLEMSHAYLREGDYENAALVAQNLVATQAGPPRVLALEVLGTAQHEMARERMSAGDYGGQTRDLLQSAQAALGEVVTRPPEEDPGEAMRRRHTALELELAALG